MKNKVNVLVINSMVKIIKFCGNSVNLNRVNFWFVILSNIVWWLLYGIYGMVINVSISI